MSHANASPARRVLLWAPVGLLLAFQFYLSSQSTLPEVGPSLPQVDKLHHGLFFFLVGALGVRALRAGHGWSRGRTAAGVVLAALVVALSDEGHQSFVPGRSVELSDVVADVAGAALAAAFAERLWVLCGLEREPLAGK